MNEKPERFNFIPLLSLACLNRESNFIPKWREAAAMQSRSLKILQVLPKMQRPPSFAALKKEGAASRT